jgi:hypothetical protein
LQEVSGIRAVPFERRYRRLQEAGKHAKEVARRSLVRRQIEPPRHSPDAATLERRQQGTAFSAGE